MAERFVEVDRETSMLLPADLREWVPEEDLMHFVIEAVKTLPTREFVVNERGSGYAHYPPSMMLALLIYCYANGIFSSRRIERASYRDLGVRYLTADTHPNHDIICKFRQQNAKLITKFFVRVLELAGELKLLRVGTISVAGTRLAQLQVEVEQLLSKPIPKGRANRPPCPKRSPNGRHSKPSSKLSGANSKSVTSRSLKRKWPSTKKGNRPGKITIAMGVVRKHQLIAELVRMLRVI